MDAAALQRGIKKLKEKKETLGEWCCFLCRLGICISGIVTLTEARRSAYSELPCRNPKGCRLSKKPS